MFGVASLFACACGGSSALEIDVRTDLVPIDEMATVWLRVTHVDGSGEPVERTYTVAEADDFIGGVRVASLSDIGHGDVRIDVEVRDALGQVVLERPTLVTLENDRAVTILLTRDCRGVTCGDAGAPLACLSGTCTDPRCTPETPELCSSAECTADADCVFAAECSVGVCSNGVCLARPDDALCDEGLWCNPDEGCVDLPPLCPELQVIEVAERTVDGGATWEAAEYVLSGTLTVSGGPLVVAPCSVIRVSGGIEVRDGGGLTFEGGPRMPITVTSPNARPSRGDWNQLHFLDTASGPDNVFVHVSIEYGGGAGSMIRVDSGTSIEVRDSVLQGSAAEPLEVISGGELVAFENNRVFDNATGLDLDPDVVGRLGPGVYGPNDIDGIRVQSRTVRRDATWLAHDAPYVLEGNLEMAAVAGSSARLTVEAGATLLIPSGQRITVGTSGGLTLAGTAEAPVTLTSASPGPSRGDWDTVVFRNESIGTANRLSFAIVEYGGSSIFGMVEVDSGAAVTIEDSTLRGSATEGLVVNRGGALGGFERNTVTDNVRFGVEVPPDVVGGLGEGAYGPNDVEGISVTTGDLERDATWGLTDIPYVLTGDVTLTGAGSAVLTVSPGVEVRIAAGHQILVEMNGALSLMGEPGQPVLVTSASLAPAPGDWNQIHVYRGSLGPRNVFRNARIEYGGGSIFGQLWIEGMAQVNLESVTFASSGAGCDAYLGSGAMLNADPASTYVTCP